MIPISPGYSVPPGTDPHDVYPYVYRVNMRTVTKTQINDDDLRQEGLTIEDLKRKMENWYHTNFPEAARLQLVEEGYEDTYTSVLAVQSYHTVEYKGTHQVGQNYYRVYVTFRLYIHSASPIPMDVYRELSPFAVTLAVAIILAVSIGIAIIVHTPRIIEWFENMTVDKYNIIKYDWVQHPETGEWYWVPTGEESGSNPDIPGMGMLFGVLPLLIIGGLFLLSRRD